MKAITLDDLLRIVPGAKGNAEEFVVPLNAAMEKFGITTPVRQAAFIAQAAHESDEFQALDEHLHYRNLARVRAIFKRHFITMRDADVEGYMNTPEMFASRIYANRLGNGDEASGDGWKYRGRGLFQITGKDNYRSCGTGIGSDLISMPEKLIEPRFASLSAAWYFRVNGCVSLADSGDFEAITKRVNGPAMLGQEERLAYFDKGMEVLA
jgi:putative chitinase